MDAFLTTDVAASLAAINATNKMRGARRMSWSRYQDFHHCQAMWFLKSFNVTTRPTQSLGDDHFSFDGKLIQKVIEVTYRNSAVGAEVARQIAAGTIEPFITRVIQALNHCTVMTPQDARVREIKSAYEWFKDPEGKQYLSDRLQEFAPGDDYIREFVMTRPGLCLVDETEIELIRGKSYKSMLKDVVKACVSALQYFTQYLSFNRTAVEMWVFADIDGIEFCGMADMVTNTVDTQKKPDAMWHVRDGYYLIDGKRKISQYQTHDQLKFYSSIIKHKQNILPYSLVLFDYTAASASALPFDPSYMDKIRQTVGMFQQALPRLQANLKDSGLEVRKPWELLPRTASEAGCRFCPAGQGHCEFSKAQQLDSRIEYAKNARATDALAQEQLGLEESGYSKPGELSI